jgi:hypothetical protein
MSDVHGTGRICPNCAFMTLSDPGVYNAPGGWVCSTGGWRGLERAEASQEHTPC